jgi:protein TonB
MSYAQRKQLSGNRGVSIFMTVAVVGSLMYAIVTGLAYDVIKKTAENLKVVDVEQQPPPPQKPPPPPKDMPKVPPPPVTPPPLVQVNTPPPPTIQTVTAPPPPVYIPPVVAAPPPPPPPPPAPARKVEPARARANLASYVSDDDYPPSAAAAGQEGRTGFRLDIGPDGRVTNCTVTSSSGSSVLDQATCRIMRSRARFTPAHDSNGNPVADTHDDAITWRLTG